MKKIAIGNNILSEKSVAQSANGKYVIEVDSNANKPEIKKQIQQLFKVKVKGVNSLNYPAYKTTFKQKAGKSKAVKRMVVTLEKGQKISEFEFDTKEDKDSKKNPKK
ncbi:MAG: 50S ribosomal protein L23 [bacterium]